MEASCVAQATRDTIFLHRGCDLVRSRIGRSTPGASTLRARVGSGAEADPRATVDGRRKLLGAVGGDQELEVEAWATLAEGKKEESLQRMRWAAELEDATEKSAVTPGPLAPARELLGEMLLEMKEAAQALQPFEATLNEEPRRLRALYGVARAARHSGSREASQKYFGELEVCGKADKPGRAEILEAKRQISQS
jgi:hypothetical protein